MMSMMDSIGLVVASVVARVPVTPRLPSRLGLARLGHGRGLVELSGYPGVVVLESKG